MDPSQIREIRKKCGLSSVNFGRLFSVSDSSITYWERGDRTPPTIYISCLYRLRQKMNEMNIADVQVDLQNILNDESTDKYIVFDSRSQVSYTPIFLKWLYNENFIMEIEE